MSQEKDDKSKGSSTSESKSANDRAAEPGKKPYATLDLKAVEVPASGGGAKAEPSPAASKAAASATGVPPTGKPAPETTGPQSASAKPASTAQAGAKPAATSAGAAVSKPSGSANGWLPSLVAGIAGALVALLGLGSMGLIGGDSAMNDRIAALEKSLQAARPTGDVEKQVASAEARLAKIEETTRAMAQAHASLAADAKALDERTAGQGPATAAASGRLQKLEDQLNQLSEAAASDPQRGRIPALAQITTKLGDLDTQLTTRSATLKSELSQEMERRLATSAETAEAARARLAQRTQSLEQTVKSVADETGALRATVDGLKGDIEARFKASAKPADVAAAVEPVASKVAGLEKNLAGVVRSEQDRNATAGNILLSIELGNLKRALDRGGKYAAELAAVKKVGGDKLNLAVLEAAQSTGVPSLAVLTTEFRGLAYSMLDAEAEPADGTVMERLLAGAKSIVRVRKVAHSADDTGTEATIGRMETSLKEGRLGDVLEEGKKLPDKAKAAASPWLKKIEARFAVETALADLEQSLKTALAGTADVKKGAN